MGKNILRGAVLAASLLACGAQAEGWYVGAGYGAYTFKDKDNLDESLGLGVIELRGGMQLSDIFNAEVRIGGGASDDSVDKVTVEVDYYVSGLIKVHVPYEEDDLMRLYGLLGGSWVVLSASNTDVDESSYSYGVGAAMMLGESAEITLEYLNLMDQESGDVDQTLGGANLGFNYHF